MDEVTDQMCEAAVEAMAQDRIQGFLYGTDHVIRDVWRAPGEQELSRRPAAEYPDEIFMHRIEVERIRLGLQAAMAVK